MASPGIEDMGHDFSNKGKREKKEGNRKECEGVDTDANEEVKGNDDTTTTKGTLSNQKII